MIGNIQEKKLENVFSVSLRGCMPQINNLAIDDKYN